MNLKKKVMVGALVGVIGLGTLVSPMIAFANSDMVTSQRYGMGLGKYFANKMQTVISETVNLSVEELYSLRTTGKSIEQIAKERGYTTEKLLQVLMDARVEQLEQLVLDGVITEDQKEIVFTQMEARMAENIARTEVGPRMNGKGNKGMNMQQGWNEGAGNQFGNGYGRWNNK